MKRAVGPALRILVSAALVIVLVVVGRRQHVLQHLRAVPPDVVVLATVLMALSWVVNSQRWGLLLRVTGVREGPLFLAALYFIGSFFSQLLPTGAGGDPVRMWDLYRRGHKPAAVVVATFQERLMGMGVSMLVALCVMPVYFNQLPPRSRPFLIALPAAAIVAVSVFLYPALALKIAGPAIGWGPLRRIKAILHPASELPALTISRLAPILAVTLAGDLLTFASWYVLGRGVGVNVPFAGYCLIIPLVWVISMAPSLGGTGVRETGFVWLMRLFHVPTNQSLPIAALYLFVQTAVAALGGVFLLARLWRGTWKTAAAAI